MPNATIDPEYYGGSEPHGYWIKSADWERRERELLAAKRLTDEAAKAVREGRACWVRSLIEDVPF